MTSRKKSVSYPFTVRAVRHCYKPRALKCYERVRVTVSEETCENVVAEYVDALTDDEKKEAERFPDCHFDRVDATAAQRTQCLNNETNRR